MFLIENKNIKSHIVAIRNAEVTESHRYTAEDSYSVRAKAKNADGVESGWATLPFSAPKTKLLKLDILERFPLLRNLFSFLFL